MVMMTMMIGANNKRYTKSKFGILSFSSSSIEMTKKQVKRLTNGLHTLSTSLNSIIYAKPCPTEN